MTAPIKRVLPTPVASAKQSDANSRSKSVTEGNALWIACNAWAASVSLLRGSNSQTVSRISSESRCGWRRLKRLAIAQSCCFAFTLIPRPHFQYRQRGSALFHFVLAAFVLVSVQGALRLQAALGLAPALVEDWRHSGCSRHGPIRIFAARQAESF